MTIVDTIFSILVAIMIIMLLVSVVSLLSDLSNYFKARTEVEKREAVFLKVQTDAFESPRVVDYNTRVRYNAEILDLIDALVNTEVMNKLKTIIILKAPYKVTDIDRDIKDISETIFSAFKKEIYVDNINLFNEDYLMSYITKSVSMKILVEYENINRLIKSEE